ncbi:hypothetical protein [Nonomuraea sp. NPDC050202]|uniref:hypothetical protein n=1 Tax=Nonomuraea sp. NPDC050202 TaxID=3155035 RepID=UPI0033DB3107
MAEFIPPNLECIKQRLWTLRWLAGAGANLPGDQVCVRGQDRRTLAWLIGTDLPDLISEVERLRYRTETAEARVAEAEQERDALRQSIAVRTPQRSHPVPEAASEQPSGNCWILTRANGGTYARNWPATTHFRTEDEALARVGTDTGWQPSQLDHPCVTITCGGCNDTFDGDGTAHFEDLEEAHVAIGESADWNRWTILPDGNYLCPTCNPEVRPAIVEAVASNV